MNRANAQRRFEALNREVNRLSGEAVQARKIAGEKEGQRSEAIARRDEFLRSEDGRRLAGHRAVTRSKPRKLCGVEIGDPRDPILCDYVRKPTKTKCSWHWLESQPIETQVQAATRRREAMAHMPDRQRVPEKEWPSNERWCSGCQSFVPLFYTRGSRCKACESQAAHAGHVRRTYELEPEEYQRLLDWQAGRCYVCGQVPRVRRLAVDHDHRTGEVRGLLCANDEWGCNVMLSRVLNDPEAAKRLVEYVERFPLQRMHDGEPPKVYRRPPGLVDLMRGWKPPESSTVQIVQNGADWKPF
jgi:hypothetical protein